MANYDIPDLPTKRLRYFNNQFLIDQDFIDDDAWQIGHERAFLRSLCVAGVCEGLSVSYPAPNKPPQVAPGVAIDSKGRMIVVDTATDALAKPDALADGDYFLHISFLESEDVKATGDKGTSDYTRWTQNPPINVTGKSATLPDGAVVLGSCTVQNKVFVGSGSTAGRQYSGIRLPGANNTITATLRNTGAADDLAVLSGSLTVRRDAASQRGPTLTLLNGGSGAGAGAAIDFNGYDPGANNPSLRIQSLDDGNWSGHLAFSTKLSGAITNQLVERLRITSDGLLRFSNEAPKDKIVVWEGSAADRYGMGLNSWNLNLFYPPGGRFSLRQSSSSGPEVFSVTSAGSLGIGTVTPTAALHVNRLGDPISTAYNIAQSARFGDGGQNINLGVVFDTGATGATALRGFDIAKNSQDFHLVRYDSSGVAPPAFDLTVLSNGYVGLGATSPAARLSIVAANETQLDGTVRSPTLLTNAGNLGGAAGSELALASFGFRPGNNSFLGIRAYRVAAGTSWTTTAIGLGMDVDNTVRAGGASLWVRANGCIGVGTASPDAGLSIVAPGETQLVGTVRSSTLLTNAGNLGGAAGSELALASFGFRPGNNSFLGIRAYRVADGTSWTTTAIGLGMDVDNTVRAGGASLWLSANGGIGIGTTAPTAALHVNRLGGTISAAFNISQSARFGDGGQNSNLGVVFDTGATGATALRGFEIGKNSQDFYLVRYDSAGAAAPAYDLTVLSNGRVGISTTTPVSDVKGHAVKLDVAGSIQVNDLLCSPGRMHLYGTELCYLLHTNGAIVSKAWGGNGNLAVEGDVNISGAIQLGGKRAFYTDGNWLRLNEGSPFPNGIITTGNVVMNSLNVGAINQAGSPGSRNAWIAGQLVVYAGANLDLDVERRNGWGGGVHTFDVIADGSGFTKNSWNSRAFDLAERFEHHEDGLEPGDILAVDPKSQERLVKTHAAYQDDVVGVVSEKPGLVLGVQWEDPEAGVPLALAGRVPVKVNLEGGPVRIGDYLTSSSEPGVAMRAIRPGRVIGIAMQAFDGAAGTPGKVVLLVNTQWFEGR